MRSHREGFSLGSTLLVTGVVATLAFTVAAASLVHLHHATALSNGEQAQNIAESTIALALEKVLQAPDFGDSRHADASIRLQADEGAGCLTFHTATARDWGIPYSTNNLAGSNPVLGFDVTRPVPKAALQLYARGQYRGVRRQVEALIYVPPFPYAIAAAGKFRSAGGLEVGAVRSLAGLEGLASLDRAELLAAHLASNAPGSQALVLGPESHVVGDVRVTGEAELDPSVVVRGEVRTGSDPLSIPKEDVRSYDPQTLGRPNLQVVAGGTAEAPTYSGFVKCSGDLRVVNGLHLDGGVLFVDGNVSVQGGVRGSGALFVTRNLQLTGASELSSDNMVAVMAGGNVSIVGTGPQNSAFQGLLYNEGDFVARQVSLIGVFIQNQSESVVDISDSRVIYAPEYAELDLQIATGGSTSSLNLQHANIRIEKDGNNWDGQYDPGNGPIAFEAYPTTAGTWELVDPNNSAEPIRSFSSLGALKSGLAQLLSSYKGQRILGLRNAQGQSLPILCDVDREWRAVLEKLENENAFAAMERAAPRAPGASQVVGRQQGPTERLHIDPSRFLTLRERARILYWKAR